MLYSRSLLYNVTTDEAWLSARTSSPRPDKSPQRLSKVTINFFKRSSSHHRVNGLLECTVWTHSGVSPVFVIACVHWSISELSVYVYCALEWYYSLANISMCALFILLDTKSGWRCCLQCFLNVLTSGDGLNSRWLSSFCVFQGIGTDEDTLIEILASRNNRELLDIKKAYKEGCVQTVLLFSSCL